jgi:hypothetical protein
MPSKKIISVGIICVGAIISVVVFTKKPFISLATNTSPIETTGNAIIYDTNDWQRILDKRDTGTTTDITRSASAKTYENEGTQTDQIAKDFLSQYLALKQNNREVTAEEATIIAQNTLNSAEYTDTGAVQYTAKNIVISDDTSKESAQKYMNAGIAMLNTYSNAKYKNELTILDQATKSGKESDLKQLDPIIKNYKGMIAESLSMPVPKDAVTAHLEMVNAISNVLSSAEGMRVTFSDPVRSFASVSRYKQYVLGVNNALIGLSNYFKTKGLIK